MVNTRGTISKAAGEKADGKKVAVGESSGGQKKLSSTSLTSKDYKAILDKMPFVGTRYPDIPTMVELGIYEDCAALFEHMELTKLMTTPYPAYQKETVSLLSTLKVNFYEPDEVTPTGHGSGRFSFRVNKKKYRMSFRDLEGVFGFQNREGRAEASDVPQAELQGFWKMIGIGEYKSTTAKSTHIRNPVLRYVHKALAHTVYARRDFGNVLERELELLDSSMVDRLVTLDDGMAMRGDLTDTSMATYLLRSFLGIRDYALMLEKVGKAGSGQISCGGLITPILIHCGIELGKPTAGPVLMDVKYLRKTTYIRGQPVGGRHNYQFAYRAFEWNLAGVLLPNRELTDITERENVDFEPPFVSLYDHTIGAQQPAEWEVPPQADGAEEAVGNTSDDDLPTAYEPHRFFFDDHEINGRKSAANTALASINTLKSWNAFQDKTIKSLLKTVKKMAKQIKELTGAQSKSRNSSSTQQDAQQRTPQKEQQSNEQEGAQSTYQSAQSSRKRKASSSPDTSSSRDDRTSSSSSDS
uniref:Arabidopsis retrotransposon Orf1 C-terminal domain-containing protein n=1 Tax=Noccaea caerulescens TaxID=107243 RepID=A0A1J3K422_NOCCA